MKICLFWATVYSGNMGVNALTYSALLYLQEAAEKNGFFNPEYVLIGTACREQKNDNIIVGDRKIDFKFYPIKNSYKKTFFDPQSMPFYQEVKDADLIIDLGEGDSFTDIYGIQRFRELLASKLYCLRLRKKMILFPQTIGPFNNFWVKQFSNFIINQSFRVYVRDSLSGDYISKNTKKPHKEFTDLAFLLPYAPNYELKNDDYTNVGINISGLLWNGGYTKNNMFGICADYQTIIRELVLSFLSQHRVKVHLISHVLVDSIPVEDDYQVCKKLQEEFRETIVAPYFRTPVEAKNYISGLDFFVGSRMHSCIAALSASVPVIPIAYSRKFTGLFNHTLEYPFVIDATKSSKDYTLGFILEQFKNIEYLRQKISNSGKIIDKYNQEFRSELAQIFSELT